MRRAIVNQTFNAFAEVGARLTANAPSISLRASSLLLNSSTVVNQTNLLQAECHAATSLAMSVPWGMRHMSSEAAGSRGEESTSGEQGSQHRRASTPQSDSTSVKGKYVLKISSPVQRSLDYALRSDVLNMLEDPSLNEHDVRVDYDARFWTPQTFYVLYKSEQMRDAALAAAGVNKKTYLGTVPVTLSACSPEDVVLSANRVKILSVSNQQNSKQTHHGRVALLECQAPIDQDTKALIQDSWLSDFDTVHPHIIVLHGSARDHRSPSNRALVYFAHPDEAARAVRTHHRTKLGNKLAQLRVIT